MATRLKHLASSAAAAAVAAGLVALGTSAAPSQHVKKAPPRLLATPATLVTATQLAPGDRVERLVELRLRGKGRVRSVYFQAAARKSSALDQDRQHGLQVAIERCTTKWRTRGLINTCPGKRTIALARRPFVGKTTLRLGKLTPTKPAHLRLVLVFPGEAGNALQAQTTAARYGFIGVG
jgi:hypothetical protein